MPARTTVHQDGESKNYDIILDASFDHLREEAERIGAQGRRVCIVTDSVVAELYLCQVKEILSSCCREVHVFVFPAGERSKTLDTVQQLYETLILHHFDRKDWLVALGGGVVGDLCGYGAATYLRGVPFIQIPTTLLAQVDSSIGGKTGVDFSSYKNMVGAFHMPRLVYTNVQTLLSLSEEQYTSGMGEVIKHGLILDREYYDWLMEHRKEIAARDLRICMEMIARSDEIKRRVVEEDPTEQGRRALLNFGHTLGHALEKQLSFSMLHGHCVGLGCLGAMKICVDRGYLSMDDLLSCRAFMESLHMPVTAQGISEALVIEDTKSDKKMDGGAIRFILLHEVGHAFVDRTVTEEEMRRGLSVLRNKEFNL
ncbi:MAG: 3-dehydroquinate synthase [Hungatella sp.]|nr:3-dehydroquinate synthase [Hungatella sp.]